MTKAQDDKTAATSKASTAPTVDGDAMSAPDQLEAQQLVNQRAEAESRGDDQAVKDIDARLKQLGDTSK